MAKVLKCGEVFSGCDTVIYGKDEDEVFAKEENHARADHNMTMIPMDTMREITDHIRDGERPKRRWFRF
jgi:predicted small metal-binding protein